jgi:BNR repeat-like domain
MILALCILLALSLSACATDGVNPHPVTLYSQPGGGKCVSIGRQPQPPYANIRVTSDAYQAHSETMIVQDPHQPLDLVGGAKFFADVAHYRFQVGYMTSSDGGCTWIDGGVFPGFKADTSTSDPSFAFGSHHEVYAAVLTYNQRQSGISVLKSTDGGRTFGLPTHVYLAKPQDVFSDKPWIAVDQTAGSHSGNVYVVWSYDHGGPCGDGNLCMQNLAFSRSIDGGRTFSPVRLIEGTAPFCNNSVPGRPGASRRCDAVQGAIPVVEPDGTIVVATPYIDLSGGTIPTRLFAVSSHDGGLSWSAPAFISFVNDIVGTFPPARYRNISLPAFACDTLSSRLYITWSDKGDRDADILFSTSADNGRTWSIPFRVNDDPLQNGANQFQPQISVAPDGVVSITFFDTRRDPRHQRIDVYLAQSVDHGTSFLKNVRVTTRSWDPALRAPTDESGLQFIGDYQGLVADNLFVHPMWNDTRTGDQEAFTAAIPSAQV